MSGLSPEAIAAADPQGMAAVACEQPDQLLDALWRVDSANVGRIDAPAGLAVCGMGGSAIGGDLAAAAVGPRAEKPIVTVRDYEPPSWMGPDWLFLCSSYSGETEETLSAYEAAGRLGAARIALTTGGRLAEAARADGVPVIGVPGGIQPRAAVAYMLVGSLEAAAACGAAPSLRAEVEAAGAAGRELVAEWGPEAPEDSEAKALARTVAGRIAVVHGSGPTDAVATRWKSQLNENAEAASFRSTVPEACHNEVCGHADLGERQVAVMLDDPAVHPRNRLRLELLAAAAERAGGAAVRVEGRGESRLERIASLVLLGDLVSVYAAVLGGVDPTPVAAIDALKREL